MISAGLGYSLGGLAVLAVWIVWLRRGRALSERFVDHAYTRAQAAPSRRSWAYFGWNPSDRSDPAVRKRKAVGVWLPLTLFAPVLAAAFLGSAVAEFNR